MQHAVRENFLIQIKEVPGGSRDDIAYKSDDTIASTLKKKKRKKSSDTREKGCNTNIPVVQDIERIYRELPCMVD